MTRPDSVRTSLTLLGRLDTNDVEAWNQFTRLYGPLVYSWCRSAGLQPEDVDDVGQEVFRVVSNKLNTFDPGRKASGAFRSWLWGITRLQVLDYFRAVQRQPVGHGGTDHNMSLQRLEDSSVELEIVDDVTSRQLLLQSAVEMLKQHFDPRTWQAFWDMAVKGRPAKDIGDELGMAAKAVRQAKFRVTKKLRELLGDDFPEVAKEFERT